MMAEDGIFYWLGKLQENVFPKGNNEKLLHVARMVLSRRPLIVVMWLQHLAIHLYRGSYLIPIQGIGSN